MQRLLASLLVVCSSGMMVAEAQIVRIGPRGGVRIRAPYASVDVLPYGGGTRVRAPFTAVNTGYYRYGVGVPYYYARRPLGRRYGVPAYPVPPVLAVPAYPVPVYPSHVYASPVYPEFVYPQAVYPTPVPDQAYAVPDQAYAVPDQAYAVPDQAYAAPDQTYAAPEPAYAPPLPREAARPIVGVLEDRLRAASLRLQHSLSLRRDDGDVWQNYLAPQTIVDTIDQGLDPQTLRELLRNYNGILANPSLASIRNAAGFSETRRLLQQFIERGPITDPTRPATNVSPQLERTPSAAEPSPVPPEQRQFPAEETSLPVEEVTTPAVEVARPSVPVPL